MTRATNTSLRLPALLFLLSSLCPLGRSAVAAEGELLQPYRLRVVLHVAAHPLLTGVFRERVRRELGAGLQAALGELARVEVVTNDPRLPDVLARGLERS